MPEDAGTRFLGFDFGLHHIGVAVGQTATGTASPLEVLIARDGIPQWEQVAALVATWQPDAFVVGLPLNLDGSVSDMSQRAQKFGRRLQGRFGKPCHFVDERLSSFEVKTRQREISNKGQGNRPIDALAAQLILQGWLDNPVTENR